MKRREKAFTLTELLVVVVIIGVLSAVVLPKYSKMLNTRRTTEAEDIMAAVRQEQEYRCASDRNYTTAKTDLSSLASLPDNLSSKNYNYTLMGGGIKASARKGSYDLEMPSYTDGRICCRGNGCDELNKEYIRCESFTDYEVTSSCTVEDPQAPVVAQCDEGETWGSQPCGCNSMGTQSTWKCIGGQKVQQLGTCSVQSQCSCELVSGAQPPNTSQSCPLGGTKTISYTCNTSNWTWQAVEGECEFYWRQWNLETLEIYTCEQYEQEVNNPQSGRFGSNYENCKVNTSCSTLNEVCKNIVHCNDILNEAGQVINCRSSCTVYTRICR